MQSDFTPIKQYIQALFLRRRIFIITWAVFALFAVSASFFVPKNYQAQTTVFIENNVLKSLMKDLTVSPSMNDRIRVLRYHMLSREMLNRTLKQMDMDVDKRYIEPSKFESLVNKLKNKTNISVRENELFTVSLVDPDPVFAKDFINTLVNLYVEDNMSDKREESFGANRFLTEQVAFYKQQLDELDTKINNFRKKTGIYSSVNEATIITQLGKDEDELKAIKGQKTERLATISTIKQQLKMLRDSTALGFNDALPGDVSDSAEDPQILQLEAKINELLLVYNDQYPSIVKLREQIEELRKRKSEAKTSANTNVEPLNYNPVEDPIYVDLKMRLNTAQSELNGISAKEADLKAEIAAKQNILRNYPADKKTLNDLENERDLQASLYKKLMERSGVSEVSQQMELADKVSTFRVVEPAILPTHPIGPKRLFIMFIGVLGGAVVGLGTVYAAEYLNESFKETNDLKELGLDVLAEIPYIQTAAETILNRKKDKATFAFAAACLLLIGMMMIHDLLGMSFIDRMLS